jgi:hypothetical protein
MVADPGSDKTGSAMVTRETIGSYLISDHFGRIGTVENLHLGWIPQLKLRPMSILAVSPGKAWNFNSLSWPKCDGGFAKVKKTGNGKILLSGGESLYKEFSPRNMSGWLILHRTYHDGCF